jgi:hypothetical protein
MKGSIPKERLNVLADMDFCIYRGGFAADTQAKEQFGPERYLEENYLHWAVGNIKSFVTHLLQEVFPGREWYRFFLGGEGNYRNNIARLLPQVAKNPDGTAWTYKGNRSALHKPKYYAELRDYLVTEWGAELVDGREADDMVSILQYARPDKSTCIVSMDKDLKNTCGHSYNPVKKTFSYVTLKEANLNFRKQVLTGDRSDCIPGLAGIGEVRATKIIKDCNYDLKDIDRMTRSLYRNQYGPKHADAVWEDNCHLLWIQREDWVSYSGSRIDCEWSRGDKGE